MTFTVTGHRGALAVEPENTLRSFRRAQADGADLVELDIHVTRDGAMVVIHDKSLDRTTDGAGLVAEHDLSQIQALDAGLGERVPTFAEVVDAVDVPIQVELKAAGATQPLVAMIRDRPELGDRLYLSSFQTPILRELAEQLPDVERWLIVEHWQQDALAEALELGCRRVCARTASLDGETVAAARDVGVEATAWVVNDEAGLARAKAAGATGFSSDNPGVIVDLLRQA